MLVIGRAMMARPEIDFFDEPSLGLSPPLQEKYLELLKD
jgi:ABC-type branched-subunit amino acid transport system ATPase component